MFQKEFRESVERDELIRDRKAIFFSCRDKISYPFSQTDDSIIPEKIEQNDNLRIGTF